jgi:hypothetical protein
MISVNKICQFSLIVLESEIIPNYLQRYLQNAIKKNSLKGKWILVTEKPTERGMDEINNPIRF